MSTAIGHDSHSDREAARAFCPSFLRKSSCFDDLGAHLLQFVGNIVFSSWLASTAYDYESLAKNAFAGYYLILGATFHAWVQRGKLWPLQWLPRTTVRNLLSMLTHQILRLYAWDPKHIFEPVCQMEDSIEYFFGQIKTQRRGLNGGSCTVANSIAAAQMVHLKQSQGMKKKATSTRLIPDPRPDVVPIAREALREVCTFMAACSVGVRPKDIAEQLAQWWRDVGRSELTPGHTHAGNNGAAEQEEEDSGNEGEDEGSEAEECEDEGKEEPCQAEVNDQELKDVLEAVETQAALENEMAELMSAVGADGLSKKVGGQDDNPEGNSDEDTDSEVEPASPVAKAAKIPEIGDVFTLSHVLEGAKLEKFQPPDEDTEDQASQRVRDLIPGMLSFSAYMRCGEGLLSKAVIMGKTRARNNFQEAEHAAAMARASHMCNAGRQARHALWIDYAIKQLKDSGADSSEASLATKIGPPTTMKDGQISYQLLVVRPGVAVSEGQKGLRFATPTSVWRVARRKVKTGRRLMVEGRLPVEFLSHLQVMLLTPEASEDHGVRLFGSSLSPVSVIEPLDGSLVYEVPPSCFTVEDGPHQVQFKLSKSAVKAFKKVSRSYVPMQPEKSDKPCSKVFMTEFDFGNNAFGRKCQIRFLQLLKQDFETHHWKLVRGDGSVKLPKGASCNWEELTQRLPGFFARRYSKGSKHWKTLCAEDKALHFGSLVMREFQSVAPTPENGDRFMSWLLDVHMLAPTVIAIKH